MITVTLVSGVGPGESGGTVFEVFLAGNPGETTYRGSVTVPLSAFQGFGQGGWEVSYGSRADRTRQVGSLAVAVKLGSLLGLATSRRGDTVRVMGSAKEFTGLEVYPPRAGIRIGVDRYAGNGRYVHLTTVVTDRLGHVDAPLRIPWTVAIRLTTPDTARTFGAATPLSKS